MAAAADAVADTAADGAAIATDADAAAPVADADGAAAAKPETSPPDVAAEVVDAATIPDSMPPDVPAAADLPPADVGSPKLDAADAPPPDALPDAAASPDSAAEVAADTAAAEAACFQANPPAGVDAYATFHEESCQGGIPCACPDQPYPEGSKCCPDCKLLCKYKDCCGNFDEFHCKFGTWQVNTWYGCPVP